MIRMITVSRQTGGINIFMVPGQQSFLNFCPPIVFVKLQIVSLCKGFVRLLQIWQQIAGLMQGG